MNTALTLALGLSAYVAATGADMALLLLLLMVGAAAAITVTHPVASCAASQLGAPARTHLARSPGCTLVPSNVRRTIEPARAMVDPGDTMALGGGEGGARGGRGGDGLGEG